MITRSTAPPPTLPLSSSLSDGELKSNILVPPVPMATNGTSSTLVSAAVGFEITNTLIYTVSLVFFVAQWMVEFFIVHRSTSAHTFVFYIILFYNVASFVANFFWFVCHKRIARQTISNSIEFTLVFLESAIYFCRHALRILSMYYVGVGVTASLLPVYVALLILSDYVFDGVFSFYHRRRSSIILVLSIVLVLPTFVHNSSIYAQPAGPIMALCWVLAEVLDAVVRYILEFSMTSYVASKNWCCFRRSRPSLSTASLVPLEDVDPTLSLMKCVNYNNYSIQWYNNVWGILLALIGIFLFEVDNYETIMDQQEIVGFVTIAVALHTLSTLAYVAYMNRVQRSKRLTAEDPLLRSLLMFIMMNVSFAFAVQVWQVIFQFLSLLLFMIYVVVRVRDQAIDRRTHVVESAVKFESEDVVEITTTTS